MARGTGLIDFGLRAPGGGGLRGSVRFVPNMRGIALLARTPAMSRAMLERAEYVAEIASSIAPRGPGKGGHYADMIDAVAMVIGSLAGARVNANKFTSGFIEFGTSDTPAFAILRTAADAAGLSLTGGGATRDDFMSSGV